MAKSYETKALTIGDITVTVSKAKDGDAGDRLKAFLEFLGNRIVDPGYGVGIERPDQGLPPVHGHPDQGLPGQGGRPDQSLPGAQPGPDQGLPNEDLGEFLKDHAKEIAAAILKGTACDPAQPKK
jgi:hypothetical protein